MPNTHLSRIADIDAQLKALNKLTANGEYLAAGLSLQLTVGPSNDTTPTDLSVSLCTNLDQVLSAIKTGLQQARREQITWAKSDLKALQAFFDQEASHAP